MKEYIRTAWNGKGVRASLLVATLVLFIAQFAVGQTLTTADAVGVVTDTTGAVVPGASVTIKSRMHRASFVFRC